MLITRVRSLAGRNKHEITVLTFYFFVSKPKHTLASGPQSLIKYEATRKTASQFYGPPAIFHLHHNALSKNTLKYIPSRDRSHDRKPVQVRAEGQICFTRSLKVLHHPLPPRSLRQRDPHLYNKPLTTTLCKYKTCMQKYCQTTKGK